MRNDNRKKIIFLVSFLVAVLLVSFAFIEIENNVLSDYGTADNSKSATDSLIEKDTVYIGGKAYLKKSDVSTFLVIGTDSLDEKKSTDSYDNSENADFIGLFVINKTDKKYTLIQINRDTMTDINIVGLDGKVTNNTFKGQIALSHAYGDGLESSCENTARAVEHLLFFDESGVDRSIDNYASVTMGAIPIINDYIGGVTVTLDNDYTELNPKYVSGAEIRLAGNASLEFIRARGEMNTPTNIARMERQSLYLDALMNKVSSSGLSEEDVLKLYDKIEPYLVTNCDRRGISDICSIMSGYECVGIVKPEGESVVGEEFMEYYVDDNALKELIIGLFFEKLEA